MQQRLVGLMSAHHQNRQLQCPQMINKGGQPEATAGMGKQCLIATHPFTGTATENAGCEAIRSHHNRRTNDH